jgi:hypothetical protein
MTAAESIILPRGIADIVMLMASKNTKHPGLRGNALSLHPLGTDEAVKAILAIKQPDVKKIIAATPSNPKRKK